MLAGFDAKPLKRAGRRQSLRAESGIPTGVPLPFCGSVAPAGFLMCNGQAVSRQSYAALFAVLGTVYGVGDGSTTFNVPNMQDRMPIGAGNLYALGASGGSKDAINVAHTHAVTDPTHTHGKTDPGHTHGRGESTIDNLIGSGGLGGKVRLNIEASSATDSATTGITISSASTGISVNSSGASGADANLPPYLGVNFIIKY